MRVSPRAHPAGRPWIGTVFAWGVALIPIVLLLFLLTVASGTVIFGWSVRHAALDAAFVALAAAFLATLVVIVVRRVGPSLRADHQADQRDRPRR